MEILDMKCAEAGKEIADSVFAIVKEKNKTESLITKSIGVLQEDGVYAFFLYLASQKSQHADDMRKNAYKILKQDSVMKYVLGAENDELKAIRKKLASNLDDLFFAKELLERTLVYARYHAKALGGE